MNFFTFLLILTITLSCAKSRVILGNKHTLNDLKHKHAPYVLMISIDGYRHDYNKIHRPEFLTWFAKEGASTEALIPSFPTKTFPNHLSIVTGLYPANHGIVANHFYAPDLKKRYSLKDSESVRNPEFYRGIPLWSLAESQGMKTATYFWPGSEANIYDHYPTYYLKYNHGTSHEDRLDQIKKWLLMDESTRPHFMTLYFHDVDSAGHRYGPLAEETKAAVHKVDQSLKDLYKFTKNLNYPLQIIIVSDHGMRKVNMDNKVNLVNKVPSIKDNFRLEGSGPLIHLYDKNATDINLTLRELNNSAKGYMCYLNHEIPKELNFRGNVRAGDIVCIADQNHYLVTNNRMPPKGAHGWSQFEGDDMHGILYAKGSLFKERTKIDSTENINIYPMIAEILGLEIRQHIDGDLSTLRKLLK